MAFPAAACEELGSELAELVLELGDLAVVAGDVGLEACDAVFELAALGSVQVPADGAEVVERLSRLVESPLGALLVVLLAGISEEHTSELLSLMRISYAVFCLHKTQQ